MEKCFSGLFGNDAVKDRLARAIRENTLAHAFLISGPEGSGKMTLAREIGAALNCEMRHDRSAPLPCHRCNTCRRIMEDAFTDIKIMRRQKDKATIGVNEVRFFREDMFMSSVESDKKIYVIDEAHKMTTNAQNALLKVLEEPPSDVVILLLSASDDAILTTIKSRAQYIAMERFSPERLREYFRGESSVSDDVLISADGRIGRVKDLISEGGGALADMRQTTKGILDAIKPGTPYSKLYLAIKELPTKKEELSSHLEDILVALRDLILLKHDKSAPLLHFTDRADAIGMAASINSKRLIAIYDTVTDACEDLSKNVNVNALITSLGARIKLI
ncbi:MAG: AAA family ATPase [Clostridia bacterium]|nr:AAA family ATPase [Clostridia bacterium]